MTEIKYANRQKLIEDFTNLANNNYYKKIPYDHWRKITYLKCNDLLIGKIDDNPPRFSIRGDNPFDLIMECYCNDGSLGQYLSNHWGEFSLEEGEDMTTATSGTAPVGGYFGDTTSHLLNKINADMCINEKGQLWCTTVPNDTVNTVSTTYYPPLKADSYGYDSYAQTVSNGPIIINKENEKMNTSDIFHFDFGPVSSSNFRMSPYGLAIRTEKNGWIAYNAKTGELMDVDILNFDVSRLIYKMPVAASAIKPGDILIHSGKPVFVRNVVSGDGTVTVIDYATASVMSILPVKSPFNFNFFVKITSLVDFSNVSASENNPFGNLLPFLMFQNDEGKNFDPFMLYFMMSNGNNFNNIGLNPMMLYCLTNRKNDDILPFLLMMNNNSITEKQA